ncbi:MAG: 3',5'-cyclic-nucleotide phosphodiesterase [Deltaproteobacteria bacterium]|nr:3',5'-cyclic-nucleotide phosphodiesterase [Deltaproteobacteria bacterium]
MEIRVLGCHGSQLPGFGFTGFLIDGTTLMDAGSVTSVLTLEEQFRIDHVLISHAHLDHVRELASLADNLCCDRIESPLTVIGTRVVIDTLKQHIFNGAIWPDFSILPTPEKPILKFEPVRTREKKRVGHLTVTAVPVHHSVETVAYVIGSQHDASKATAIFVGDTGPTDEIWRVAEKEKNVRAIFVETSLPEGMADVAQMTGHLTPEGLARELRKLGPVHPQIYLYHMKIQYHREIRSEIDRIGDSRVHILHDGEVITI